MLLQVNKTPGHYAPTEYSEIIITSTEREKNIYMYIFIARAD